MGRSVDWAPSSPAGEDIKSHTGASGRDCQEETFRMRRLRAEPAMQKDSGRPERINGMLAFAFTTLFVC